MEEQHRKEMQVFLVDPSYARYQHNWETSNQATPTKPQKPNWCPLCTHENKTMDHLFLSCSVIKSIRDRIDNYFNATAFNMDEIDTFIGQCADISYNTARNIIISNIIFAPLWHIWLERNRHIFSDVNKITQTIREEIIVSVAHGAPNLLVSNIMIYLSLPKTIKHSDSSPCL